MLTIVSVFQPYYSIVISVSEYFETKNERLVKKCDVIVKVIQNTDQEREVHRYLYITIRLDVNSVFRSKP